MKKILISLLHLGLFSISSVFAAIDTETAFNEKLAEQNNFKDAVKKAYPPERAQVQVGTNIVTPFYAYYGQRFPASVNKGGKMAASTYGTGLSWQRISGDKSTITLVNFNYRRTDYRWSGGSIAPFSHSDRLDIFWWNEWVYDEQAGRAIAAIMSGSLTASDTVGIESGLAGALGLGIKQYFSKDGKNAIWLGMLANYSRHRERWSVFPMFLWDISLPENLSLSLSNGIKLTWNVDGENKWLLSAGISYAPYSIAVARGELWHCCSAPLILTATWNFNPSLFISTSLNTILWSDYRNWKNGHESATEHFTVDPSVELALQIGFRF